MELVTGVLLCLATGLLYIIAQIYKFWAKIQHIGNLCGQFPSFPKHWLWGHIHLYRGPTEEGMAHVVSQLKYMPRGICTWRGPLMPTVMIHHPATCRDLLHTDEPKPLGLGVYHFAKPWLGDGLLISRGAKHQRNRKLLTPAFHFDILKPYVTVNNEAVDLLLENLEKYAESGKYIEMFSNMSLCTLDIILRCAFSYTDDIQRRGESHPYVQAVVEMGDLWVNRVIKPWLYPDIIYSLTSYGKKFKKNCDFVHSVSEEIIRKRKKTLEEEGEAAMKQGRYIDFLDILLTARDEDGNGLTDAEIRDEVDTFLFEGHDTTASGTSWTIYALAKNPEFQEQCRQEVDTVLSAKGRHIDYIEWGDLPKLQFLTMCIKEALRLYTPVPHIERQLTKELEIDEKVLPAGAVVAAQLFNLHHNPTVWEDPMEFRPSRFLPENIDKKDPYAFLPFSAGPRNCIGQNFAMHEMKIIVARVLHRFKFSVDPNRPAKKKNGAVMRTMDGMWIKFSRC